jgi:hypothetical protein
MSHDRRAWRYLLPSIADLLFIGLLLTRVQPTLFHDADTGWHLWAGSVTLEHGPGPIPDALTFTQSEPSNATSLDLTLGCIRLHQLHSVSDQSGQIRWFKFILFASLFDSGKVEDIFNK